MRLATLQPLINSIRWQLCGRLPRELLSSDLSDSSLDWNYTVNMISVFLVYSDQNKEATNVPRLS